MTTNHIALKIVVGTAALGIAAFMATMIPELRRYFRIRRM